MEENENVLSLEDFTILMFGMLAKNSKLNDLDNSDNLIACLPFNFKQNIENILCANNGWKDIFSILIDVSEYFDDHFMWEMNLSYMIKKVLNDLNKNIECDLVTDMFYVCFNADEVSSILDKYEENIINKMDHFTNLLTDYIYTRQFQEMFWDYSASAVKKMQDLRKKELYEDCFGENNNKVKRKNGLMRLLKK